MLALDKFVEEKGSLGKLVDRHIAAFIARRIKGAVDNQLAALEHSTGVSVGAKIAMTGLLAKVQNEYQHQMTPNLTAWLLFASLPGIVASFKTYSAKRHANAVRSRLEELKEEWGEEISGIVPESQQEGEDASEAPETEAAPA